MKIHFLLVHGNWSDVWSWRLFARNVAAEGYGYTLLSNPNRMPKGGVGPIKIASTADYTKHVCDAADRIKAETGQYPVIVGHSLGAVLAMQAAAIGKARALILAAPSLPSNMPQPLFSLANIRLFLPWIIGGIKRRSLDYSFKPTLDGTRCLLKGWAEESIELIHEHLQPDSGLILKEFAKNLPAAQADLGKIECPTLCIAGLQDEASPPDQVQRIAEAIRGARFSQVDSHHFFMLEKPLADLLSSGAIRFLESALEVEDEDSMLVSA
jgi:non-heme chloroperoxidase